MIEWAVVLPSHKSWLRVVVDISKGELYTYFESMPIQYYIRTVTRFSSLIHPVIHYYRTVPWKSPYAIVNNGRALSYGHPPKLELTLENHPLPLYNAKFDYTVPIMGQP